MRVTAETLRGCLIGTAIGDAIGLPYEGLSPGRGARLFGRPDRMRFLFGRGMISDDAEHACLVAQSLIAAGDDPDLFVRELSRRLRNWFLKLPAGIGLATVRACVRLCLGFGPDRSGVFSAGNGPAMRSAILGAAVVEPERLRRCVVASARVTHTDPKAACGAIAVALAARFASQGENVDGRTYLAALSEWLTDLPGEELLDVIEKVESSVERQEPTTVFAESQGWGRGVSGYINHSVPVCLHAWLSHQTDYRSAVTSVVECGGDADSTAAVVGGIVGCRVGLAGVPTDWLDGFRDWPWTVKWMTQLADQLAECRQQSRTAIPLRLPFGAILARNAFFLAVVLGHGFRRLAPPY